MAQVPIYLKDYEWTQISPDAATPFRAQNKSEFTVLTLYSAAQPPARGAAGAKTAVDAGNVLKPLEWFGRTSEAPAEPLWGILQQASNNSSISSQAVVSVYSA